ncbi:MAG: hypothetical protein DMF61_22970 [Blastocatellia bacterium AA13]|nr:MAG: hypothetical protein DMF61_22970 [Blastocatellia bacterium AA13]
MRSEHLTENEIDRCRTKVMAAGELFAAHDHMAACDACYYRFTEGEDLDGHYDFILSEMREAEHETAPHLRYEEMVAYVNGQNDGADGDVSRTHLEECAQCDSDVADLRLFKSTIGGADHPKTVSQGAFGKQGFGIRALQLSLAAAASVLLVLGAVWLATATLRSRVDGLQGDLAQIRSADETLREQLSEDRAARELQAVSSSATSSTASAMVTLKDGVSEITFDGKSALSGLESVPNKFLEPVKSALRSGRLSIPAVLFKGYGGGVTRSGAGVEEPFHLIAPAKITVASNRPAFRWTPMQGAERYIVYVRDSASDEQIESGPLTSPEWTPDKPLASGRVYSWSVEALKDGQRYYAPSAESPSVVFKILEGTKAQELEQAKRASHNSHLLMSVLYAREGLITEAQKELRALKAENPRSDQVKSFISDLRRAAR